MCARFVQGKVVKRFKSKKNGKEVVIRYPKWEDLDDLVRFVNLLVGEHPRPDIHRDKKTTKKEEARWLAKQFAEIENCIRIMVVAELDGKVVGSANVRKRKKLADRHVGELGIAVTRRYRDTGIGSELIRALLSEAKKKLGIKLVKLDVFSTNKRAIHVYETTGFREVGKIPKGIYKNGRYIDKIIMVQELW